MEINLSVLKELLETITPLAPQVIKVPDAGTFFMGLISGVLIVILSQYFVSKL